MKKIIDALVRAGMSSELAADIAKHWQREREPLTMFLEQVSLQVWDADVELGGCVEQRDRQVA